MRSIWKGHIRFSLVTIPIQIFNAIDTGSDIRFNQLHNKDNGRIKYKKECLTCGEEVPFGDLVKGYEYEPDQYVVFAKKDFNGIKLKSNRAIDIEAFVDLDEVHPSRFEAVYFIGPNGDIGQSTFSLLRETLINSKKAGVGRIILRDKEDVVLLVAEDKGLIMYKLRYPYEVRKIEEVPDIKESSIDESQLQLAQTLVDSLTKPFSEIDFEDRYRDALLDLVQDKVDGKEIVTIGDEAEDSPVVDIMDALKRSIDEAKKKKAG